MPKKPHVCPPAPPERGPVAVARQRRKRLWRIHALATQAIAKLEDARFSPPLVEVEKLLQQIQFEAIIDSPPGLNPTGEDVP